MPNGRDLPTNISPTGIPLPLKQNLISGFFKPLTFRPAFCLLSPTEVVNSTTWLSQFPAQSPFQVPGFWNPLRKDAGREL